MSTSSMHKRASRVHSTIATRAMMAAQMAVAARSEVKSILKNERERQGVPIFYAQSIAGMVSHTAELAGQCASASLAALEHLHLITTGGEENENSLQASKLTTDAADFFSRSAAHQALSAKNLVMGLEAALKSRGSDPSSTGANYTHTEPSAERLGSCCGDPSEDESRIAMR